MITACTAFLSVPAAVCFDFHMNVHNPDASTTISRRSLYGDRPQRMLFIPPEFRMSGISQQAAPPGRR
jgi:hypothetical protein